LSAPGGPAAPFTVFPAIDLRAGRVVRLSEGDPRRQTTYADDPAGTARRWLAAGAAWLHVVNLDGAFGEVPGQNTGGEGGADNLRALAAILDAAREYEARVQFGGGLRSLEALEEVFKLGVGRAVLGTSLVERPELLAEALRRWGAGRIAAGLDARDGKLRVRGWQQETGLEARDLAQSLKEQGLEWMVFTDISRDGLRGGLNLEATQALARSTGLAVIASGGVATLADVQAARQASLAGVIVGRALYEGSIDPQDLF